MKSVYKHLFCLLLVMVLVFSATPAAFAVSTTSNVLLFDQASPNYTTTLSSQITVTYKPNGTDSAVTGYIKNLGWHFARYGNTPYEDNPLYCIEPHKNYAASTSGNYMDTGVPLTGSGSSRGTNTWYALPQSYREAIMLILLYSDQLWDKSISVTNTAKANNPNVGLRIATQFLIYEIVCSLRDAGTFERKSSNGYTNGNVFYNAGQQVDNFATNYNRIVSSIQAAKTLPSFTGSTSANAPTITLTGDQTSVTDSNGVLSHFSFSAGNGASFTKSGNSLVISQTGDVSESTVFTATRNLPSPGNSSVAVYYPASSSYQTCVNLYSASSGSVNAYFKLQAPAKGSISITKSTSDGKNLSGWQFSVYSDSACSNLVAGPASSDSSGQLTFLGLTAGTYFVKELGNTNSGIGGQYTCTSTNPQKVTVTSGAAASVRFVNQLNNGTAALIKTTNTGKSLSGWKIGIYTDKACTNAIANSPFTTGQDGTINLSLQPGTYYAKELPTDDSFWEIDPSVKTLVIRANETASVSFSNTHYGRIEFHKTTNTGNHLGGWVFHLRDSAGNTIGEYTTDENGYATTGNLLPGRYLVTEKSVEDNYWQISLDFHTVIVEGGRVSQDNWHNVEQGLAWFLKETNTEGTAAGWEISIYSDEDCTERVCGATITENGSTGYYLNPGIYYAKESGDSLGRFDSEYWQIDSSVYRFEVKPHETITLTFRNTECGKLKISKTMQPSGSPQGWQFKVTDAEGNEISGSPFTMTESGVLLTGNLLPGKYTVEELIPDGSLYVCQSQNPQIVTVSPSKTSEVFFTNCLKSGSISIHKVNNRNEALEGATFLLEWSEDGNSWEPIVTAEESHQKGGCTAEGLVDGCLTTDSSGIITWDDLHPGLLYRVTEISAPEGYELLADYAFEGNLPEDDLALALRVVNGQGFVMPETGSTSAFLLNLSQSILIGAYLVLICITIRKKNW